jgi:hypothetical protein
MKTNSAVNGMAGLMMASVSLTLFSGRSPEDDPGNSSMVEVDYPYLISRADLVYHEPVSRSEEGMPVGNGRMGSLVWTTPDALKLQVNRVDVFANNAASNNFYERHTDYCGGTGFIDIDFVDYGREVFTAGNFFQHLSCYDGLITTRGDGVELTTFAWHEKDVMVLKVRDERDAPVPVNINLRMLRDPVSTRGNHTAISTVDFMDNRIILKQEFKEDEFFCASAVVVGTSLDGSRSEYCGLTGVRLSLAPGSEDFTVFIASAASFDPEENVVALALKNCEDAESMGAEDLLRSNKQWWHRFWGRSFVHLHSEDGEADLIEANYHYFLYVMASSSRGILPPKFNGMLWTTGGDARMWGSLYWGANQSCLYNGLFPANRIELMDPMFNMYSAMYPSLALAAKQQWDSKGIWIPETVGFDGVPELPEDIAAELKELYLMNKPWEERSEQFKEYAFTKMPFSSRWNWKQDGGWSRGRWHITDKGAGPFGHVTHIFSRGAKIAYQYWLKYEYTGDRDWLRTRAYPMIRGIAEFYRNYPGVRKEGDGRYHIYLVNDNEPVWGGHNTAEEISSMMGIFPVAIKASEMLGVDEEMRPLWQDVIDHLSALPVSPDLTPSPETVNDPVWIKSLPPVMRGNPERLPDPNTMPMWFFDLCNLECPDPAILRIANNTFDAQFREGINENTAVYVLSKLPVTGTTLGRKEATRYLIPNQIRTRESEVMRNRMTLREGYQTTGVQRLGRVADALHNALCQSIPPGPGQDPIIRIFPAWPGEWDGVYSLLARGGFLVTSSMTEGDIDFVEIFSNLGGICRIRNPWEGPADIYQNGIKAVDRKESLLEMETRKGEVIVLVPHGMDPRQCGKKTLQ